MSSRKGRAVGAVHSMVTMRIDQDPAGPVSDTFEDREREAKTAFEGCLEVAWRNLEPLRWDGTESSHSALLRHAHVHGSHLPKHGRIVQAKYWALK